ncbi:hypothetical protein [Candidatus Neoehrlichia procyonis]|uniref:Uncharacterized protein n=1 Tax=Candidatus Neoehrlichia procyonis str. RAC413 TaxID=1359163 RepID=A0A0F3NMX0_9RICK|nr:hypothetical protein [Candidatus Neoehrlichia lotoris]KJV69405.1 hypothetical protein NLO413_0797 [Candidatus Neoehrlichia lotoris str. RAC413]
MNINGLFYIEVYQCNHVSNNSVIYGGKVKLINNANMATFSQILWILGGLGAFEFFEGNIKHINQLYSMQISIGEIVKYDYSDLQVKKIDEKNNTIIFEGIEAKRASIKIMLQKLIL